MTISELILKSELIWKTFRETVDVMPETFDMPYPSYDQITFPEGYEKPPKELFENKFNEFLREEKYKELREERNKRLTECDWVATKAFTTGTPVPDEWKAYMQALRDLPANTTDPENPVWPQAPSP